MQTGYSTTNIEGLTVGWNLNPDGNAFSIILEYNGDCFVRDQVVSAVKPRFPFSYYPGVPREKTEFIGVLKYSNEDGNTPSLILDLSNPISKRVILHPGTIPVPVDPDDNPPDEIPDKIGSPLKYQDLFPYLYIHPWPAVAEEDRWFRFVQYKSPLPGDGAKGGATDGATVESSPPGGDKNFYQNLVKEKKEKDREAMKQEAVDFIDKPADYTVAFIASMADFKTIMKEYYPLGLRLREQEAREPVDFTALTIEVHQYLGGWQAVKKAIKQPEYVKEDQQAWQSFFALAITLGYRCRLLEEMVITLVTAAMLEKIADKYIKIDEPAPPAAASAGDDAPHVESTSASTPDSTPDSTGASTKEIPKPPVPTPEEIYQLTHASIQLPTAVFPLPPAEDIEYIDKDQFIKPYAVGALQMVRYRPLRYRLGEISHIRAGYHHFCA